MPSEAMPKTIAITATKKIAFAERSSCGSRIRVWRRLICHSSTYGWPLVWVGALAGVGSSPNPHIVSPKITIKVVAKLTIVPQPRREWSE
jgi:hypothetical protein